MTGEYIFTVDDFLKAHPELPPEKKEFLEVNIQNAENAVFAFIISYIFM
jgi:hypothetical protein